MFEKQKIKLDENKNKQINELYEKYEKEKQKILERLLNEIIKKGD